VSRQPANCELAKREYITSPESTTLDKLAKKYKITRSVIYAHSSQENWVEQRKLFQEKISKKLQEKIGDKEVELRSKYVSILSILIAKALTKMKNEDLSTETFKDCKDTLVECIKLESQLLGVGTDSEAQKVVVEIVDQRKE
jgi:hypothetical protein